MIGSQQTVQNVAALARHASMSSSYKPALLKSLIRIVHEDAAQQIRLIDIGAEFVRLYWVQTVVFRLRQAHSLIAEPEVVRHIRSAADLNGVRELSELPPGSRDVLEREMARTLTHNVLEAFHRSKPPGMPVLFSWSRRDTYITIDAASATFLRANAYVLESIANLWWARFLEKVNALAPLVIAKVERNGAERGSLAKFLRILRHTDVDRCFYCERPLGDGVRTHVDHVIPWSFLLDDPMWDLVLSCSACNLAKSDVLPERGFIDKLVAVGARRSRLTLPPGFASAYVAREEIDRYYDAALSIEWPSGWTP